MRDRAGMWPAVGAIGIFSVAGVNLVVGGHPFWGGGLPAIAVLTLFASAFWFFVWPAHVRRATTEVVEWLEKCANFGTQKLLNAEMKDAAQADQ